MRWALLIGIFVVLGGCMDGLEDSASGDEGPDAGEAGSVDPMFTATDCQYQESLLTITVESAQALVPPDYEPYNGLTGGDDSATLFVVYLGCEESQSVMAGVVVHPPTDVPGNDTFTGYLLGTYIDDAAGGIMRQVSVGPTQPVEITYDTSQPAAVLTVEGNETITITAVGETSAPPPLSDPEFHIRVVHEIEETIEVAELSMTLTRSTGSGSYEGPVIFGHNVPPHADMPFRGSIQDLTWKRIA